jgi:hypothetical protein
MKYLLLVVFSIAILTKCASQELRWGKLISLPNKNISMSALTKHYDKGYYIEAMHWANPPAEGWNFKTDVNGNMLWDNHLIYNQGKTVGTAVEIDNEGNRFIGGILSISGPHPPFVSKFNSCGEQVWCRILPIEGYGQGVVVGIVKNVNEEIIIAVQYNLPDNPQNNDKLFLFALNDDGGLLWVNGYSSPTNYPLLNTHSFSRMTYHNTEYFLSGHAFYAYPDNPNLFWRRPYFIGIDSLFNEKWILPFHPLDSIFGSAWDIIPINDTLLMGTGNLAIGYNSILMFFNVDGVEQSYSVIQREQFDPIPTMISIKSASKINDSLVLIPIGLEYENFFLGEIVCNLDATIINQNITVPNSVTMEIIKTESENYVISAAVTASGYRNIYLYKIDENLQSVPFDTTTYVYDSICPNPIPSCTIDLTGCMVLTSTDWIPTPQEYYARIRSIPITIYPNPAKDQITFALENTEHHRNIELRCFNLLGMQQHQTTILRGQQQASAKVSAWPPGMYVVVVYSDSRPVGRGKFVVQR